VLAHQLTLNVLWLLQQKSVKLRLMIAQLKKYLFPLSLCCLLAVLAFSLLYKSAAPDITFTTIQGKNISMASLKGKVVLVSFWATDCPSCNKEMPDLISTYNAYKTKGFEVIAVAMPDDPPAQVLNYVTQKKLPFPVMHDSLGEVSQTFGNINATPTAFLFDKNSKRLSRTIGILDFAELRKMLDKAL
jgi:peroxiredoxin